MKPNIWVFILLSIVLVSGCKKDDDDDDDEQVNPVYKQEMRNFVQGISQYAKNNSSGFIVIPQNGQELVSVSGDEDGTADITYLNAIDGVGREDLFYGYDYDNEPTPVIEIDYMMAFLDICKQHNVKVLVTDYCSDHTKMDDSYNRNNAEMFISFAAPGRDLNLIPDYPAVPFNGNSNNIVSLSDAKNFLYLIDPEKFASKQAFIDAVSLTNYDVIIMDLFFTEVEEFTASEIDILKTKANGGKRLVIAYLSIGEAEDYRYYWEKSWYANPPDWLESENPDWPGNYIVRYWMASWQQIIYGSSDAYLDKILNKGFDGAYLDIIDAFEFFE